MRINLNMSIEDAICEMVEGNPGALNVCMQLMKDTPDGFLDICRLDDLEIHGSNI